MSRRLIASLNCSRLEDRVTPALINFALDVNSSTLTLGGSIDGAAITEQATGSLTTKYAGNVQVDVDFAANTIQAISLGSTATAQNNGNRSPGIGGVSGNAPANYGGKFAAVIVIPTSVNIAIRGAVVTMDSTALPLSGAGATKTFPSQQSFTVTAGTIDYRDTLFINVVNGTESLIGAVATNAAVANGQFTDSGNGNYSLTGPIDITISDTINGPTGLIPAIITLKGSLSGSAVLPVVDLNGPATGNDAAFTTPGTPGTAIAPAATITRSPVANLNSMTVTLANALDGVSESLAVDLTGTGLSSTGYDPVTGKLTITGNSTLAQYQSVLRNVTYSNLASNPTAGARDISVSVSDASNASLPRTSVGTVTAPPAKIQSVVVNDGVTQRSMVRSVTVTFDRAVTANGSPASFVTLSGPGGPATLAVDASGSTPSNTVYRLTFSGAGITNGSLANGRYTLTVPADNGSAGIVNFDGDNNGTAGGDFVLVGDPATNGLFRLFGDADGNGQVDPGDFLAFRLAFLSTGNSVFDQDDDNTVGPSDFLAFRIAFLSTV